jgi:hypothetical protein
MEDTSLIGRKIVNVRSLTHKDLDDIGWEGNAIQLVLDDGSTLTASGDPEGNHPGSLFYDTPDGKSWVLGGN